jgi:hypothetical protein
MPGTGTGACAGNVAEAGTGPLKRGNGTKAASAPAT